MFTAAVAVWCTSFDIWNWSLWYSSLLYKIAYHKQRYCGSWNTYTCIIYFSTRRRLFLHRYPRLLYTRVILYVVVAFQRRKLHSRDATENTLESTAECFTQTVAFELEENYQRNVKKSFHYSQHTCECFQLRMKFTALLISIQSAAMKLLKKEF